MSDIALVSQDHSVLRKDVNNNLWLVFTLNIIPSIEWSHTFNKKQFSVPITSVSKTSKIVVYITPLQLEKEDIISYVNTKIMYSNDEINSILFKRQILLENLTKVNETTNVRENIAPGYVNIYDQLNFTALETVPNPPSESQVEQYVEYLVQYRDKLSANRMNYEAVVKDLVSKIVT